MDAAGQNGAASVVDLLSGNTAGIDAGKSDLYTKGKGLMNALKAKFTALPIKVFGAENDGSFFPTLMLEVAHDDSDTLLHSSKAADHLRRVWELSVGLGATATDAAANQVAAGLTSHKNDSGESKMYGDSNESSLPSLPPPPTGKGGKLFSYDLIYYRSKRGDRGFTGKLAPVIWIAWRPTPVRDLYSKHFMGPVPNRPIIAYGVGQCMGGNVVLYSPSGGPRGVEHGVGADALLVPVDQMAGTKAVSGVFARLLDSFGGVVLYH
jgi:hypothetical protein